MRLYQRDLRSEPLTYAAHLPPSLKVVVVGFYILLGIGVSGLGAYGFQMWKTNRQATTLQNEIVSTEQQRAMLESVLDGITRRWELVSDIQAWLQNGYDLESVYHDCVGLVPRGMLLQSFAIQHLPQKSTLEFSIIVEGDSAAYNPYFRALTSYFSTTSRMKIADIQIDVRRNGAILTLEVLLDDEHSMLAKSLPELTQNTDR